MQISSWALWFQTLAMYILVSKQEITFHCHTEQLAELRFCTSLLSEFGKADRIKRVLKMNIKKQFHNLHFLCQHKPHLYMYVSVVLRQTYTNVETFSNNVLLIILSCWHFWFRVVFMYLVLSTFACRLIPSLAGRRRFSLFLCYLGLYTSTT
jgi:hypothetical protein